jgi:hypothetical protein
LPHEAFAAAYSAGDATFQTVFLGDGGADGVEAFWTRQWQHDWVRLHPAFTEHNINRRYAIPIGLHADKGQHVSRDKLLSICWGSCLSRAPTAFSKILFTVCPDELLLPNETDEQLYAVWVWSLHWMMLGVWPPCDHNGHDYPATSFRGLVAGKPLAGGYRCVFAEYRGDWEFMTETFKWRRHDVEHMLEHCLAGVGVKRVCVYLLVMQPHGFTVLRSCCALSCTCVLAYSIFVSPGAIGTTFAVTGTTLQRHFTTSCTLTFDHVPGGDKPF